MPVQAIHHVLIAAPRGCDAEVRRYYGGVLGLRELERPESLKAKSVCWFALGGDQQLHLGVEEPFTPARKAHPAFLVDDFDEFRQRLLDHSAPVVDDAENPGVRRFFSYDPFGNRLEFVARSA